MSQIDDPPDLSELSEGNEYKVYYLSDRTGNEVDRTGVVTMNQSVKDGRVVRLYVEEKSFLKRTYLALAPTELKDGSDAVAAFSMTVEAERPNGEDPPKLGEVYTIQFTTSRRTFLGLVKKAVRQDGPGPFLVPS